MVCVEDCEVNLNYGIFQLIADWALVDDSVFVETNRINRPINFILRIPHVNASLFQ
jgi:hypothetical protein